MNKFEQNAKEQLLSVSAEVMVAEVSVFATSKTGKEYTIDIKAEEDTRNLHNTPSDQPGPMVFTAWIGYKSQLPDELRRKFNDRRFKTAVEAYSEAIDLVNRYEDAIVAILQ